MGGERPSNFGIIASLAFSKAMYCPLEKAAPPGFVLGSPLSGLSMRWRQVSALAAGDTVHQVPSALRDALQLLLRTALYPPWLHSFNTKSAACDTRGVAKCGDCVKDCEARSTPCTHTLARGYVDLLSARCTATADPHETWSLATLDTPWPYWGASASSRFHGAPQPK